MLNARFLCTIVFVCKNWKKKLQSACVVFCMNNTLFLRKNGDMSMHAVILYHAVLMRKCRELACCVFLVMKLDRKFSLHV